LTLKTSIFEIYLDKKIDLIDESDSKSFDGLNIIELDDIQTSIKDIFKCLKKKTSNTGKIIGSKFNSPQKK